MKPAPFETIQRWAEEYIKRGYQVVPLEAKSKAAQDTGWLKLVFKPSDFRDTDNIGLRSVNGLVIIDLDCPEAVYAADKFLPPTQAVYGRPKKPRSKRLYRSSFEKTIAYRDQETGTTLSEIRSSHQDMAPPSTHPDSELLEWDQFDDPGSVDHDELERAMRIMNTACLVMRYYAKEGTRHPWCLALAGTLKQLGVQEDAATRIITVAADWARDVKVSDRLLELRTTYAKQDDDPIKGAKALKDESGKDFVKSLRIIWGSGSTAFILDDHGEKILANHQENVRRALEKIEANLTLDTFSQKVFVKYGTYHTPLDDAMMNILWFHIHERFHFRPTIEFFERALQYLAHQNQVHPVRDYLDDLKWDGVERVDHWLIESAKAKDAPYVRAVSSLPLIAAVKRIKYPGAKFDEMLVLESTQGKLKSSAIRALCPNPGWFSDDLPLNEDSKEIIERTLGKWIIEASDLSGMHKSQVEMLKAMLSRQVDGPVRMAYARLPIERQRQFIIIGTTNSHQYLKDSTGSRRIWPVQVQVFDIAWIERWRDQLWAEAVVREARGESVRLDPRLHADAAAQQERRRSEDPWEPLLAGNFGEDESYRVTPAEVWDIIGVPMGLRDDRGNDRINGIMQRLGFRRMAMRRRVEGKSGPGVVVKGWGRDGSKLGFEDDGASTE